MTKTFFVSIFIFFKIFDSKAQFYYKDIITNKQLTVEVANLKTQKIKLVSLKSFEDDGTSSNGFFCEKKINKNFTTIETVSTSNVSGASILTSTFYNNGLLAQTIDSSDIAISTSAYKYNTSNNIVSVVSIIRSSDDDFKNQIREEHIYHYNSNNILTQMQQVKNLTDTTMYLFWADENNNITIEKNTKTNNTYYYYYNESKQITDIVRINENNKKMLPDYIFEYDAQGLLTQMTTTEEGGSYYFVWQYTYQNGLRTTEKCFSKEKHLMGRIEYEYQK